MNWWHQIAFRLQPLFRRQRIEKDLGAEIDSHLAMQTEANLAAGMSPQEAHDAARREFGGIAQIQERFRDERGFPWIDNLQRDLAFASRQMRKNPGFTAVAVMTLALGIGVNAAVFSLVNALCFQPPPFRDPDRIVQFYTESRKDPGSFRSFSIPLVQDLAKAGGPFDGLAVHSGAVVALGEGVDSRRAFGLIGSANFFDVLGVSLARGRPFTPAEEIPGGPPVVIVSHAYWKKTGFDPGIVGSTLRINGRPYTVVGLTPKNFSGPTVVFGPELYFPLGQFDLLNGGPATGATPPTDSTTRRDACVFLLLGRLQAGVTLASARSALDTIATRLEKAYPIEQKDQTFRVEPLPRDSNSNEPQRRNGLTTVGLLFLGVAGIVLLTAGLNLANLLLARSAARRKEFAIRLALGGGRARLIRQLLTEGLVLSLIGGGLGLLFAAWSTDALAASLGFIIPEAIFFPNTVSPTIIGATLGFSVLATLIFALGPAWKFSRGDVIADLKEQAAEGAVSRRRWMPRNPLVVAQMALSLGLLTCAALFIRAAVKAGNADMGFRADHTLVADLDARLSGYDENRARQTYRNIAEGLASIPGVDSASIGAFVPFGFSTEGRSVRRAGVATSDQGKASTAAEGREFVALWNSVGADYFKTVGLSLLRGRAFNRSEVDNPGGPRVAIIDQHLADDLWPDGNALGQRIHAGTGEDDAIEVIGVVPEVRYSFFRQLTGAIYIPFAQGFRGPVNFHIRTHANTREAALALIGDVRKQIQTAAPGVPVFKVRTFRQHLEASGDLWLVHTAAILFSLFGGLALGLAVVGLYGVKAYAVSRRTREIGIRMALGANRGEVVGMILREGLVTIAIGGSLGLLLGLGLGRLCSTMLYDVGPADPLAFTVAPAILVATAIAACLLPAWRASRVNPLTALRTE